MASILVHGDELPAKLRHPASPSTHTGVPVIGVTPSTLATSKPGAQNTTPLPERQIDLSALNFEQPKIPKYQDGEILSNPSLLFQDVHAHVEFIDDKELVVHFSDVVDGRV